MRRSNLASSPLSASAPESGRMGAAYVAADSHPSTITSPPSNSNHRHHNHHHGGIARASSTAVHTMKEKFGKRSRSALGLSSRSSSVSSEHSSRAAHSSYDHLPLHPAYDSQTQETPRSTTSSASSSSVSSSPLSVHGDETLVLAPDRRQLLVDFVDRSVDDAYNLCHGFGSIRWNPTKNREGVSIYRAKSGELSDDPRLDASVRGKCMVSASFDEMMDTLITETTSDFVGHESSVNPSEFLDGQVLATLVPRTRSDRFVCLKWHCIKSHAPSVAKHRDYIYVEVVDQFTDRDGRKVGFRLSKSVDLEELQGFDHSAIFVRGKTLTLHTFSQVSPGNLELYTMMINDLGERLPAWLVQKIIDTAAMRSACLRDHINQKRMDLLVLARPKEMVPLHKRVCCVVCTRSFSLVRKKYNCVACGDVICNQCSVHQFVAPPTGTISDFVGKKKARICVKCSTNAKRRELPKRRSSNAASKERPGTMLHEMDHRRGSGSTIATASSASSSSMASQYNRIMRSASSVDASSSVDSGGSYSEESGRVHPTGERSSIATSGPRPKIPQMFNQFRPVVKPSTSTSSSLGRSSVLSNSRTSSSSPEDEAMLRQESMSGAHDDDQVHGHDHENDVNSHDQNDADPGHDQHPNMGSEDEMDFDNLLDESALDRSGCDAETDAAMAEYRKTLVSGAPTHNADDDELTDADDEDETFQSSSSGSSNSTLASSSGSSASATTTHVEEEDTELIIEEVSPQSSFQSSSTHTTPRPSIVVEEPQVMKVVKPVVIKQHTKKRFGVGGSSRAKAVNVEPAKSTAPPPAPPSPPHANPLRESIVVRSRRATLVDDKAPTEGEEVTVDELEVQEAIQLADLQVHLDRMTMISESLKSLQRQQSKHDAAAEKQTLAAQLASISKIEMRAQQEAAIAAGFVQALLEEASVRSSEMGSGRSTKGSEFPLTASFIESDDEETRMMEMSLEGDVHLVREDGSFSNFLADSSFSEISSTASEGQQSHAVHGWVAVHSMTTGKTYYYNESCGTTSWTMPTPDTDRKKFGTYMVL